MSQILVLSLAFALIAGLGSAKQQKPPVKDGFYKITDELDGGVLTATKKGKPREVITADYKDIPAQQWKVKTMIKDGIPLQMIRNEDIRDNEVSKTEGEVEGQLIMQDWNLMANKEDRPYFELNNGVGCLESQGKGKRVTLEAECDDTTPGQQWKFEFLYDIPPPPKSSGA